MTNRAFGACGMGSFFSQFYRLEVCESESHLLLFLCAVEARNGPRSLGRPASCRGQQYKPSDHLDYTVTVQSAAETQPLMSHFKSHVSIQPVGVSKCIMGTASMIRLANETPLIQNVI